MGHNEYNNDTLRLQKEGFDFLDGKTGYKSEIRMIRWLRKGEFAEVCVITLWDDDTVTKACNEISRQAYHAGFVQR